MKLWLLLSVTFLVLRVSASEETSFFSRVYYILEATFRFLMYPLTGSVPTGRANNNRVSYKNYQLLRVLPRTNRHLADLESLEDETGVQFWKKPMKNRTSDMIIPPQLSDDIKEFLEESGIEFSVLNTDIQKSITRQNPKFSPIQRAELKMTRGHSLTWSRYHRYQDILQYFDYLHSSYPNLVELLTIGKSSEGRPLKVLKVFSPSTGKNEIKPAIWIDGGVHGREWISPAVSLYVLRQLVENFETYGHLVKGLDWYIMPVFNPDGYEYTHTTDRFWRKSRSNQEEGKSSSSRKARFLWSRGNCQGADLNRNFDFHWGEKGASDDPCRETYSGSRAFSEPETKSVSDFIMEHKDQIKVYLSLHSYSQMWLVPWGYTRNKAKDYEDLMYMAEKAVNALEKIHGTKYEVGSSPSLLYPTSGSSDDWAKGKAGIKFSYTVELPDKGSFGFLLPASQINPTGRETFAAIRAIARTIIKTSNMNLTR